MRRLYFTLLTALTLATAGMGCSSSQKWHEVSSSQPVDGGNGSWVVMDKMVTTAEPPMKATQH